MSSSSQPHQDPHDPALARAQCERATDVLVTSFTSLRAGKAALDALEIRTLATAAKLVEGQRELLTTTDSRKADIPWRTMVAELATAAHLSERTIQRQLADAVDLTERFDGLIVALEEGRISRTHVTVIHEAGWAIDDADARTAYVAAAVRRAEEMTAGRLRPIAKLLAARADTRSIDDRHAEACTRRTVWVTDRPDGMADLTVTLAATLAHGIHDRLTQQAQAVIAARPAAAGTDHPSTSCDESDASRSTDDDPALLPGATEPDTRTLDQLRADVFADLLLTGTPESCVAGDAFAAIRANVQVTVPVLTLAGQDGEPALLTGHGPIDADTARRLAGGAKGWERVMTSPTTGAVLGIDRYRPNKQLKRFLRARDEHCRFPGCRMPVWRCDIDHTRDAVFDGRTEPANLAHLCRGHHTLKHASRWGVRQTVGGVLEWVSPTGRTYIDKPECVVRFEPPPDASGTDPQRPWDVWNTASKDHPSWHYRDDGEPPGF